MKALRAFPVLLIVLACSRDVTIAERRSTAPPTLSAGAPAPMSDIPVEPLPLAGRGAVASAVDPLHVHIEDMQALRVELITLACAGDCVDVEAIATGGNPPYAYAWEDGSASAKRHACATQDVRLRITVNDARRETDEFAYPGQVANAELALDVLACNDAGTPPPPPPRFCIDNPSVEGAPGMSEAGWKLPGWTICSPSPDVGPTPLHSLAASQGSSFLIGGVIGPGSITGMKGGESAGTRFCAPLAPEQPVSFSVDLAVSTIGALTGAPLSRLGGVLQLWAATESCGTDELLWTSPIIESTSWKTYCATFTASESFRYLRLIPIAPASSDGSMPGFVYIDNFRAATSCN